MMRKNEGTWNRTLIELWMAIGLATCAIFAIGIWFVPQKLSCSIGLILGMCMALMMSLHMSWTYNKFLSYPPKKAQQMIALHSILRYLCTAGILFLILISGFANPLAAFVGLMGLKAGAYLQPLIHRFTVRKYPDPEPPPGIPDEEEEVVK